MSELEQTIEELEAKKRESIMDWIFSEDGEAFWEENGVPLTPEQKADLEQQRRILLCLDPPDLPVPPCPGGE